MGSLRDAGILKEAGKWATVGRATKGILGKGFLLGMGGMMGSHALGYIGEMADKGPVGIESKVRWQAELARREAKRMRNPEYAAAKRAVNRAGHVGTAVGGLGGLAYLIPRIRGGGKANLLAPVALAILGRLAGRGLGKMKNPLAKRKASLLDEQLGMYGNLLNEKERAEWMAIRNNPKIKNNPEAQAHFGKLLQQKAQQHPAYRAHKKKTDLWKKVGIGVGVAAMGAALMYGKKIPGKTLTKWVNPKTGKKSWFNTIKNVFGKSKPVKVEYIKYPRGIFGRPNGLMSRDPMVAWAGLGLGSAGLGIASSYVGAKRAGLKKGETAQAVKKQALGLDTGLELLFYGSQISPRFKGFKGV